MMLAPFVGTLGTVVGMVRAFRSLSEADAANSSELSSGIALALEMTAWGLIVGLIGFALILVSALVLKNRERWFYQNCIVVALLWFVLLFPVGALFGGILLYVFFTKRGEFNPSVKRTTKRSRATRY